MNCLDCGAVMTVGREDVPYRSLPGTVLVNVEVYRCPQCGEYGIAIPHIEDLDRLLASIVIFESKRLSGDEIRFLRKYLGLSGADLARQMGVTPETVSRWESGKKLMGPVADRLLRLMVAYQAPIEDYFEALPNVAQTDPSELHLEMESAGGEWRPRAA